jgi:hypothetical protein
LFSGACNSCFSLKVRYHVSHPHAGAGKIVVSCILIFCVFKSKSVMGEVRGAYNILVGRPEGRRPLGRPRRRWEYNIMIDLWEIGFGDVDWIHWAHDRDRWRALVNTVMNLRVP